MSHRFAPFGEAINAVKRERRYRSFVELERDADEPPFASALVNGDRKRVVVWCSNDYLGMSRHPSVIDAACAAARRVGVGAGGTRNISGNSAEASRSNASSPRCTARGARWYSHPAMCRILQLYP